MTRPAARRVLLAVSLALLLLIVFSAPSWADGTSITDGTFNLSNYNVTPVYTNDPSVVVNFAQCSTCGNPGNALQINMTMPNPGDYAAVGFVNNTASYNPATQTPLADVNASVDKNIILNVSIDPSGTAFGNTFRPLIEQDGNFYLAAIPGPALADGSTTGYNTISQSGLTAANFLLFNFATGTFGTANPNFSGDPMFFGLAQITQNGFNNLQFQANYDNLSITAVPTPEPSSLLLLASGLAGLLGVARRRLLIS